MSFKARITRLEKLWYGLEAEHYSRHWSEFYENDPQAKALSEELDEVVSGATPPFWFWPGKESSDEDWRREFGWSLSRDATAEILFDELYDRLKKFVDRESQPSYVHKTEP
jgi:hypothetical protein